MSDTINNKFKSTYGLDASNEKVINVADADRNSPTDGVNVRYLIQENTIQQYDPNRGYAKTFAVVYNNRVWTATRDIPAPAGPFVEQYWQNTRNDPKWVVNAGGNYNLNVGDYISIDTTQGVDINLTLPANAADGDTVTLKDIGGRPGYTQVQIVSNIQSIVENGTKKKTVYMSHPLSQMIFVYNNRLWNLYTDDNNTTYNFIDTTNEHQAQASEYIVRNFNANKPITIILPRIANDGDVISIADTENAASQWHTIVKTYDQNKSLEQFGTYQKEYRDIQGGQFVFNATNKLWKYIKRDQSINTKIINSDTNLNVNDEVLVYGSNNSTATVNLTLPTKVDIGDKIKINLTYIRPGMTVNINANPNDSIWTNKNSLQFPKRSSYKPTSDWFISKSLNFNGEDYLPVIELAYQEDQNSTGYWIVASSIPTVEKVDSTSDYTRARFGVIAIANQNQANVDKENGPNTEVAITPETLSNRTSLETRRGIARIATTGEVNQDSSASYYDDIIITPKKLNERTATETRRGLAEIATQVETNSGVDDTVIITPKKLEARRATDSMAGIAPLVKRYTTNPRLQYGNNVNRDTPGNGVYNFLDYSNIVTPATLREYQSAELQLGAVYLATESEVIAGADNTADINHPIVVTPFQLHKKTATEGRIGFTQIATQSDTNSGTDDFKFVTPKKLDARRASETLAGISPIATQQTFNSGSDNTQISTPLKIKTWFNDTARSSVNASSGLLQTGTIWSTLSFDIQSAQESQRGTLKLATQSQTANGTDDTTAITPLKLANRKATEATDGIIRIATAAETTQGTANNLSVSPKNLLNTIQIDQTWEANQTRRGTVKLTEKALTWVGNDVQGNTQSLDSYMKTGYAVSPYEMNSTLQHYLPIKAKAVDSDLLDGIDSSQFVRRDIDQIVNGKLTLNQPLQVNSTITASGDMTSNNVIATNSLYTMSGLIRSNDTSHYIDLGQSGRDQFKFAAWGGQFTFVDTNTNTTIATINNTGISTGVTNANNIVSIRGVTAIAPDSDGSPIFGNTGKATKIQSSDANTVKVQDSSGSYSLLTEKNYKSITGQTFVNKAGDTMSGRLTVNAPMNATVSQDFATITKTPDANTFGHWSAEITAEAVYRNLPGYVVPVFDTDRNTGQQLPSVSSYQEIKGPGTLSQFGATPTSAYQIWAPRPVNQTANNLAQTFYIRSYNPVSGQWDGFGRIYTSNNPPTANDIGAIADNGSSFKSMKVQNWLQIDNLRISPDPTTKSVRFEWID